MTLSKKKPGKTATAARGGRYHTSRGIQTLVWIRAAGHCELCGACLTEDLRTGRRMRWGEVAHIMPASAKGPRSEAGHTEAAAAALTDDPDNLLLACPACHHKADCDSEGYPARDLQALHQGHIERVRLAATVPDDGKALALIFLSQHFETKNLIGRGDLLRAMSAEGLTAIAAPIRYVTPPPLANGRDATYWRLIKDHVQHLLTGELDRACTFHGDPPVLAVDGVADIPALMVLGQALGDRIRRRMFSLHRTTGMQWPDLEAAPPDFDYSPPPPGNGPIALVISISGEVPDRDVLQALPHARIARLGITKPNPSMVKNRGVIDAFREALQAPLSELEALTGEPIHVFAAIPAAMAIEFGAFLTMQHRHPYSIYDREQGVFVPTLALGHYQESSDDTA